MRKLFILSMMLLLMVALSSVAFAGEQDFVLVNKSGVDIHYVYICPHTAKDWGDDVMGRDILKNGESVKIVFRPGTKSTYWDIQVEDMQGNTLEWENFNLKEISKITLMPKGYAEWE